MNLGAFGVITSLRHRKVIGDELDDLNGLYSRAPVEAVLMLVFMLSLAGIPPLAGFWGKYFIFLSLIETGHYALASLGVLYSVFGLYYYLKIANAMFMGQAEKGEEKLPVSLTMRAGIGIGGDRHALHRATAEQLHRAGELGAWIGADSERGEAGRLTREAAGRIVPINAAVNQARRSEPQSEEESLGAGGALQPAGADAAGRYRGGMADWLRAGPMAAHVVDQHCRAFLGDRSGHDRIDPDGAEGFEVGSAARGSAGSVVPARTFLGLPAQPCRSFPCRR